MSLNKVMLIGNVGQHPEVRHLQSGNTVANISLATNESYKDRNGEKVTSTEWHTLEVWDKLAEVFEKYVTKGDRIFVEGKIKTDTWEDDGVKKYRTKIRVTSMTMLGGSQPDKPKSDKSEPQPYLDPVVGDDDMPF